MSNKLSLQVEANLDALQQVQDTVEEFGETQNWPPKLIYQINLVLEELSINIINYAYDGDEPRKFDIRMALETCDLTIDIIDDGRPFNPLSEAPKPDLDSGMEDRPIGGLGIHLVRTIMDDFHYKREADRNHVTLIKKGIK